MWKIMIPRRRGGLNRKIFGPSSGYVMEFLYISNIQLPTFWEVISLVKSCFDRTFEPHKFKNHKNVSRRLLRLPNHQGSCLTCFQQTSNGVATVQHPPDGHGRPSPAREKFLARQSLMTSSDPAMRQFYVQKNPPAYASQVLMAGCSLTWHGIH